jgi:hypothetical protein
MMKLSNRIKQLEGKQKPIVDDQIFKPVTKILASALHQWAPLFRASPYAYGSSPAEAVKNIGGKINRGEELSSDDIALIAIVPQDGLKEIGETPNTFFSLLADIYNKPKGCF